MLTRSVRAHAVAVSAPFLPYRVGLEATGEVLLRRQDGLSSSPLVRKLRCPCPPEKSQLGDSLKGLLGFAWQEEGTNKNLFSLSYTRGPTGKLNGEAAFPTCQEVCRGRRGVPVSRGVARNRVPSRSGDERVRFSASEELAGVSQLRGLLGNQPPPRSTAAPPEGRALKIFLSRNQFLSFEETGWASSVHSGGWQTGFSRKTGLARIESNS